MATYYVQTNGDDANNGSEFSPWASLDRAANTAVAGDLVIVRGGEYLLTADQAMDAAGASGNPITYRAEDNEDVVLNGQNLAGVVNALDISADWQVLKGFHVKNVLGSGSNGRGITVRQDNNRIVQCKVENCSSAGLVVIGNGTTEIPADNHIIDVDAKDNATGFWLVTDIGTGNRLEACRSWQNSNHGISLANGAQPVLVHGCWLWDNTNHGIVLGPGSALHTIEHCIAALNGGNGFDWGGNAGVHVITNNSADGNGADNFDFDSGVAAVALRNNLSLNGTETINAAADDQFNSWNSLAAVAGEIIDTDPRSELSRRRINGFLPQIDYPRPKVGGGLTDSGENSTYIGALEPLTLVDVEYIGQFFKGLPRHKEREYRLAYNAIYEDVQNLNAAAAKIARKLNQDSGVTDTDYLVPIPLNFLNKPGA